MLCQYLPSCDKSPLVMVQNSFYLLLKSANILLRFFFFYFCFYFTYLAVLVPYCCVGSFLVVASRNYSLVTVHGLFMVVASLAKHRFQGVQASVVAAPGLQNTGSVDMAQFFCSMWYLPTPGIEPISVVLAGRFFTTEPPGNPG